MKPFFARKKTAQDEKTVLFVCHGDSLFYISKNEKNAYSVRYSVVWPSNLQLKREVISCTDTIPCSSKAVEEALDLLKRYEIVELLEDVRQSTYRDIECYPPSPFRVELDYADTQYSFQDFYGCGYEKSCNTNTQLIMKSLMLKFAELFFLIRQGKV